jgi:hypothetical protein
MLERGGEEVAQALINLTARLQVGLRSLGFRGLGFSSLGCCLGTGWVTLTVGSACCWCWALLLCRLERGGEEVAQALINLTARLQAVFYSDTIWDM